MNAKGLINSITTNPTVEQLTYNKNTNCIYNFSESASIYCGNLIFNDFSTSKVTEEEQAKFKNCLQNMNRVYQLLPSLVNNN
jgi:hypothetical protein